MFVKSTEKENGPEKSLLIIALYDFQACFKSIKMTADGHDTNKMHF
jgi:hypothetical protein